MYLAYNNDKGKTKMNDTQSNIHVAVTSCIMFMFICFLCYSEEPILQKIPFDALKNDPSIQESQKNIFYKKISEAYQKYPQKARIAHSGKLMLQVPRKHDFNKVVTHPNKEADSGAKSRIGVVIDPYLHKNSCIALIYVLKFSYINYLGSARINSWFGGPLLETPFDFTANYCTDANFSFISAYFNVVIFGGQSGKSTIFHFCHEEMTTLMHYVVDLFHGYEKSEKITPVEYLNCAISTEKDFRYKRLHGTQRAIQKIL